MEPLKGPGQLKAMQFVQKWLVPHKYFYLELHNFKFKNSEEFQRDALWGPPPSPTHLKPMSLFLCPEAGLGLSNLVRESKHYIGLDLP